MEIGVQVEVTCSRDLHAREWGELAEELRKLASSEAHRKTAEIFHSMIEERHQTSTSSFYIGTIGATQAWCAEQAVFLVTSAIGRIPSLRNDAYVSHIHIEQL
jgi:hypothetical protein